MTKSNDSTIVISTISVPLENQKNFKPKTFEDTLEQIGGFGLFQLLILIALLLPEIPASFVNFISVFVGTEPIWNCTNSTGVFNITTKDVCSCNGTFSTNESSIVVEWELYCDRSWVGDTLNSVFMFGMLIGAIFTCQLSDWFGRKVAYPLDCALMIIGTLMSAIAQSPIVYGIARFIAGVGLSGFMGQALVYPIEFLTPKWRLVSGSVGPWGEGIMIMALIGYYVRDWRMLLYISCIPFVFVILSLFVPESPKWLLRNRKLEKAGSVLKTIAKVNGKNDIEFNEETLEAMAENENQGATQTKFSYSSFFRHPELRNKSIILFGIWFSYCCVYYGLNFNVKNMQGSQYINMFLMGLSDAIGYPLALLSNNRLGRRLSLIMFMCAAAVFLVILTILDIIYGLNLPMWIVPIMCLFGKIGIAGARSSVRLLTGETYPTSIRTMAFGMTGVGAGLGGMIAPQIVYLGTAWWHGFPFLCFAIICVFGSILSLMIPETAGKTLQERM